MGWGKSSRCNQKLTYHHKDLNSIALFTPRETHGPLILDALKHGFHVFSAVPMSLDLEENHQIIECVKQTRQIYFMAETCYYFPCAVFCRKRYQEGQFGEFVYGESQYYHDMSSFYYAFAHSGGAQWKRLAGVPPMYYPTHSISMLLSALNQHVTKVSAFGFSDHHPDQIFGKGNNNWDNPFSNETAIMRLSGGGLARINEYRRIGSAKPSSYLSTFAGTQAVYSCSVTHHQLTRGEVNGIPSVETVDDLLNSSTITERTASGLLDPVHDPVSEYNHLGFAKIQDRDRLPQALQNIGPTKHYNSHPFLVDDFVRAVCSGKLPPCNAWDAARFMIPGLIAHESAKKDGLPMEVPDFGDPPADWPRLYEPPKPSAS